MNKKGTRALASGALMSLVLTTALSAAPVKAAAGQVTRTSGADRYATAAQVATTNWTTSDNVVLVSGEGYADAVSASALAKKLNAPILLTTAGSLNADTKEALTKLSAKNIYVVGGNASVAQSVRTELKANYTLVELGGNNRYETNAAVAQKLVDLGVDASNVIMVGGEGFSDALSVAPVAAAKGQILLLGMNDANYIKPVLDFVANNKSKVTVVGTKNVISDAILAQVNGTRVDGGKDRWDTNLKVLAAFKDAVKMDKMYVASAAYNSQDNGYADALVASALAGKTAAPLVLVDKDGAEGTTNALAYVKTNATTQTDLNVIGGTGVVSDATVGAINNAVNPGQTGQATVKSIEMVNLNQFKVTFNTAVNEDSAKDVTNYKIDGTQLTALDVNGKATDVNGAIATKVDDHTVVITLAQSRKQFDNVTVSVKNSVLTADKNSTVAAFDQVLTFQDITVPTMKSVTVQGNSKITVEFTEAVNMVNMNTLKGKVKIDGQNISNYGLSSDVTLTKLVDSVTDSGNTKTLANKVEFYFDAPLSAGKHTLKIADGDLNSVLCDAAGFTFKEASQDFTVDTNATKPAVKEIKETASGEISITFDRAMDKQTALKATNYQLNGAGLGAVTFDTDNNDCTVKIKGLTGIQTGSNTLYISNNVKDAYGNKVADDTRLNFEDVKDETKPTVKSVTVVDSETIRVKFSKDVNYTYATNLSNYKLEDNKSTNVTTNIFEVKGVGTTSNTDTYDIKMKKATATDDYRLTGSKYTLTIKNIVDTASKPNTMDDYTTTLTGKDDIAPKVTGVFTKTTSAGKDQVIIYFNEAMDSDSLTNKANYKFVNGEGDSKALPTDATVSVGGDCKSAIIEFSTSYHVKTSTALTNSTNDVIKMTVNSVKDAAGNVLDGVAYTSGITVNSTGATVKDNTIKAYYSGDDLKVDVQFTKAIDNLTAADFTLGGVAPSSASVSGDKVTLVFTDGALATDADKAAAPVITFANSAPVDAAKVTKIDLVKAQGQAARLAVKAGATTTDESGAVIATLSAATATAQNTIYDNLAAPKTVSAYWTATTSATAAADANVYVTFDTVLDANSGIKTDDFTFAGANGTDIKADSVAISGNTVVFTFSKTNTNYAAITTSGIKVKAKSTASIRTQKDADGNYAVYAPSTDDLKERTVTVTAN